MSSKARSVEVDGIQVRDYGGAGSDVVLLHGVGGNLEATEPLALRLVDRHRVVTLDLPGCGQSDPLPDGCVDPFGFMADVVAKVIVHLELDDPDLIGHSLGGMVASRYMAARADTPGPARLVSIDGFPPGRLTVAGPEGRSVHADWLVGARHELEVMTAAPIAGDEDERAQQGAGMRAWLVSAGFTPPNLEAVVARQFVEQGDGTFRRRPDRAIIDGGFAVLDRDVLADYRVATVATLVIRCAGWAPPPIDLDLADLAATRTNVEVVTFAGSHLAPAWEGVAVTAELIRDFWSRHPRS